ALSAARLSFVSLDEILHLPVVIREVVTAESSYWQSLISLSRKYVSLPWHTLSRPDRAIGRSPSRRCTAEVASLPQTNDARSQHLAPLGPRRCRICKSHSHRRRRCWEGLPLVRVLLYHGNDRLTKRCSELSGAVTLPDHNINLRQPVR